MRTKVVGRDGRTIPITNCIDPSNHVDTFTVVIRSLNGVKPEDIKKVIEQHYETVQVLHDEQVIVAK
jgi:hypothetical protein